MPEKAWECPRGHTDAFSVFGRGTLKRRIVLAAVFITALSAVVFSQESAERAASGNQSSQSGNSIGDSQAGPSGVVDERELALGEQTSTAPAAEEQNNMPSLGVWDFARMILVLGAVVGAIYLVFFLLKRTAAGRYSSSTLIKHVGSLALPGNKFVHLVEVGRQMFLVGTSDHNVNLLSEITDQETLDEIRLRIAEESEGQRRSFSDLVAGMFAGSSGSDRSEAPGGAGHGSAAQAGNPFSFMQSQKERLRNLR